jgi:hypothetical protein
MSRDISADAGFLYNKAAVLDASINDTLTKSPKSGNV